LAEHVCQLIISEFDAQRVKIKVAKPHILPDLKALGVVIERFASERIVNNNA
jgi:7,8-dihydroneopterin aldolase/epimerase/oxygenase